MISVRRHLAASALLGAATLWLSAGSALAASKGFQVTCTPANAVHWDCTFPTISNTESATITYTTVNCKSTGPTAYNIIEYQLFVTPPNNVAVGYQAAGNRASVAGVANFGGNVNIHVHSNTAPTASI